MPLPIAAAAAANPELVNKAASGIGKAIKIVGIAIGAGLAGFIIYKVVKKTATTVKDNQKQKEELEIITKKDDKDGEATLKQDVLISMANSLYTAFDQNPPIYRPWCSYDDDSIIQTLSKLQTVTDWKNLCEVFGTRPATFSDKGKDHNLVWFLGANSANHKADFQAELTRIGFPNALGAFGKRKKNESIKEWKLRRKKMRKRIIESVNKRIAEQKKSEPPVTEEVEE